VCLSDGQSADSDDFVRPYLQPSRRDIHLVVVGVNLTEQLALVTCLVLSCSTIQLT